MPERCGLVSGYTGMQCGTLVCVALAEGVVDSHVVVLVEGALDDARRAVKEALEIRRAENLRHLRLRQLCNPIITSTALPVYVPAALVGSGSGSGAAALVATSTAALTAATAHGGPPIG